MSDYIYRIGVYMIIVLWGLWAYTLDIYLGNYFLANLSIILLIIALVMGAIFEVTTYYVEKSSHIDKKIRMWEL